MSETPPKPLTLRERREKAGLTQAQLATASRLSRSYIQLLEYGLRTPSRSTSNALAAVLDPLLEDTSAEPNRIARIESELGELRNRIDELSSTRGAA